MAKRIFSKFNGHYMFPESHAFAFGVTAYQAAWMKRYHLLEFYVAIFNQQPMGFYNLETLKEDAKRHGVRVLNPDANLSREKCTLEDGALRLGFLNAASVGATAAGAIVDARDRDGDYHSIAVFMERTGLLQRSLESLANAGAFDSLAKDPRAVRWEIGLRYRPVNRQLALSLPVEQDTIDLDPLSAWERMEEEYRTMGLHPAGHVMAYLRKQLGEDVITSAEVTGLANGAEVTVAGLVIRRQRPLGKAVFITLEDEHGHTPLVMWPKTYERYRRVFREPLVVATGTVSRREGTMNVLVTSARKMPAFEVATKSKDWS